MRIHISLNVQSLESSIAFYTALLGHPVTKQRPAYANFRLDEPPVHLALMESEARTPGGATHYGVELPDHAALDAWRNRLETAGVKLDIEEDAQCCYARADKLWLTDPDGHRWEIWVRTGEHDAMGSTRVAGAGL